MAYVPGFAWDLFMSYPREHAQWVQRFRADLESAINQRLPSKDQPKIYLDSRSFQAGQHSREMLEASRSAALFLAIVSPAYVAPGKYTLEELKAFCSAGRTDNRIISVYVLPIDSALRPAELRGPRREDFFWNNSRDVAETLMPEFAAHASEYHSRISTVAQQIINRLDDVRRLIGGPTVTVDRPSTGVFKDKAVLLAQVTDDLVDQREEVRVFLEQFGVTVLPQGEYPDWGPDFINEFQVDLTRSHLFVQLLSAVRSPKKDGEAPSCAQFQSGAATGAGKAILQWRSAQLDLSKVPHHYDAHLLEGAHVLATGLEEFKREIKKALEALSKPPELPKPSDGPPYVYITADDRDLARALDLQGIARRLGAASKIMEDKGKLKDFKSQMGIADAVVFLYGEAPRRFVDDWLATYVKIKRNDLKHSPRVEAVYYAPPAKDDVTAKLRTTWDSLHELGSQDSFSPEDIEKVLAELRRVAGK